MTEAFSNRPASLADYLTILRRRAWVIAIPLILAPVVTYIIARGGAAVYQASAGVYINRTPATSAATGIYDQSAAQDPVRFFQTQAVLARDPALIARVAKTVKMPSGEFAGNSSVDPSGSADLLYFNAKSSDPDRAAALANAYAAAFTKYKPEQDAQTLTTALTTVQKKMATLRGHGVSTRSQVYTDLLSRESQLQTALALQAGNAPKVVQPATGASQISPRPKRDALLGLALGAILGVGLAFVGEALDKRVRSERDIEEILGIQLLARIPTPPRRLRSQDDLPIIVEPRSAPAEAVRKLRTNLDFVNLDHEARTIMITSALEQEGKSTTIASLAVALARSGRRVALVDCDLRKPYLHRFFSIPLAPGVADVVGRRHELQDALKPVLVPGSGGHTSSRVASYLSKSADLSSLLAVLPAGSTALDPGDVLGSPRVAALLEELKRDWDFVLVDAPPIPAVHDALALSAQVDAILVVTRFGTVPRRMLHELSRVLDSSPAKVLGFVLTGSEHGETYDYGYGYGYGASHAGEAPTVIPAQVRDGERRRGAGPQRQAKRS